MNNLNQILNQLTATIMEIVERANARATAAEGKLEALASIISNDNAPVEPKPVEPQPVKKVQASAKVAPKVKLKRTDKRYADTIFLNALTHEFQSAPALHQRLARHGVSLGLIYKRYRDLANNPAMDVEADGNRYRLIAPKTAPDAVAPAPAPKPKKSAAPAKSPRVKVTRAANDDQVTLTLDHPQLVNGCGLEMMRKLPDASVDLVLCDLPYGITGLEIDPKIDVEAWMTEMRRIVTDRGAIVAFCVQPFATDLMNAGRDIYKYDTVWEKPNATNFQHSKGQFLRCHETMIVFSKGTATGEASSQRQMTYNPQGAEKVTKFVRKRERSVNYLQNPHSSKKKAGEAYDALKNCPRSVIYGPKDHDAKKLHPFAKPIWLLEYLIRTFSNEGEIVLDPTMGSGSAGIAALNTKRRFVGAENGTDRQGRDIFEMAKARIGGAERKVAA
ncbi:DNA-methyltransferase [Sphingomonas xinjiangensis]|uniref:site-specific DNA-methyltransferase (adenine-specific) n=1 Tax=Sphingomonas xinjiangensis TaxID=643568 RepID=A0A840YPS9_9SPHN|nr:DNA methyltransferase [Sphingomonas xinjiangensis]MBB5709693.1 DNA modification methylase [Sphingomonas xinjiangensis]